MRITIKAGRPGEERTEALMVGLFEEAGLGQVVGGLDQALGGMIGDLFESGDFSGKADQTALLYPRGSIRARRLLLVGLGKKEKFDQDRVRQALGKAGRHLMKMGIQEITALLPDPESSSELAPDPIRGQALESPGLPWGVPAPKGAPPHAAGRAPSAEEAAQAAVEGVMLACYQYKEYKTTNQEEIKELEAFSLIEADADKAREIERGARVGEAISQAINRARDLANGPGNAITPKALADEAQRIAQEFGLKCQVLDEVAIQELGMGGLLGVAQGSQQPPRFIILEYEGAPEDQAPIVLIGKGLTFDSGGICIKPSQNMEEMKYDMCGAAAVMGAVQAAAALKLPLRAVSLIPATENLPSGTALKPGDILRTLSGKTIEVINTDAEGRLVLADALAYAERYQPAAVIDLATLTGACVIALGHLASGLLGNHPDLIDRIKQAAERSGERVWELPLWEEYQEQIKSDFADVKNSGGRPAGTITAAAFLGKFAEKFPWAHLDIAGTAWTDKEKPYQPKGATGVGVRLLVQLLRDWKGTPPSRN